MFDIELVGPAEMPDPRLDAYAVDRLGQDACYVVREDATPERIVAALNRLGAHVSREVIDATLRRRAPATE